MKHIGICGPLSPFKLSESFDYKILNSVVEEKLKRQLKNHDIQMITGLLRNFDLKVSEVFNDLDIDYFVFLAYEGQADNYKSSEKEKFDLLLERAAGVESKTVFYRPAAAFARDRNIVECSDELWTIYRQTPVQGSRLDYILRYAKETDRKIVNLIELYDNKKKKMRYL